MMVHHMFQIVCDATVLYGTAVVWNGIVDVFFMRACTDAVRKLKKGGCMKMQPRKKSENCIQRSAKRYTNLAKQDPGRARQNR